jgi:putative transposase
MKLNYKFRLYPSGVQVSKLEETLMVCRGVYNTALTQRRWAWRQGRRSVSYYQQATELAEAKASCPELGQVHSQVLQDVLRRLDKSFYSFFRRVARGEKSGYPRYKGRNRYDSFNYPQSGFSFSENEKKLKLSKIGSIRIRRHRPFPDGAAIKTCTIKREGERWYAVFSLEIPHASKREERAKPPELASPVGVDAGLTHLVALSTGETVEAPGFFRRAEEKLVKEQRRLSRKKKGSNNRDKQRKKVARAHGKVANQRRDFLHKLSRRLVNEHDLIVLEDLRIKDMARNRRLSKSITDAGWGTLAYMLNYKAEEAGGLAIKVSPKGTSQACSGCGAQVPKDLSVRVHLCPGCGLTLDRDVNAAINILALGLKTLGLKPAGQGLPEPGFPHGEARNACGDSASSPPPTLVGVGGVSRIVETGSSVPKGEVVHTRNQENR